MQQGIRIHKEFEADSGSRATPSHRDAVNLTKEYEA
jgi:hypothetical protein